MTPVRIALGSALAVLASSITAVGFTTAAQAACSAEAEPARETEAAAQRLAELCDTPVEVLAEANETTKVLALPNGNFSLESYVEPQRVERDSRWVALDLTLQPGSDGRLRPRVAADVSFSAGGSGPLAVYREGGADFTLTWPDALPAGVVDGDAVTYPEVYPGADLVVRAVAGGFSHVLVVKTPEAAANPKVRSTAYGIGGSATVTETDGEVVLKGPHGVIAGAPRAAAWDSTRTKPDPAGTLRRLASETAVADPSTVAAPGGLARQAEVDVEVTGKRLTVRPDAALLDGASRFPIYIDPTYSKYYQKWIPVNDSRPDTKWTSGNAWPREVIRIGSNFDNYGDIWRAHTQFDVTSLRGKRIIKTPSVEVYLTHTAWCAGESLQLWQTNAIDGNTPTWNGMKGKWLNGGALQTKTVKANSGCSGQKPSWAKFNAAAVKTRVQVAADGNASTITFGLRMKTESGGHWAKAERGKVKLAVEYQSKPTSPVAVRSSPGGNCNKTSPGPWINDSTPALYGKAADADNSVKIVFDVNGPTSPADHTSGAVASNAEAGWTTGALADGNYNWKVYGTDGTDKTGWSATCYFRQDHTPPTSPVITRTSGTPVLGQPVTLSFASTDAGSGVLRFEYGIGVDAKQTLLTASSGKASLTFTPDTGRTQVYVWARDNAANYSARAIYNVFTGRVTPVVPLGVYRMTYDLRDDSGTTDADGNEDLFANEKDLTLAGSGTTYGTDRLGKGGAALYLNGSGCAGTPSVLRSDAPYTVSAWVKLTDKTADRGVLTLAGTSMQSLALYYDKARDRWNLGVSSADVAAPTWSSVLSPAAPAVNTWEHVAATVDPVGKLLRLYVNGKMVAETAITVPTWHAGYKTLIGCSGTSTVAGAKPMVGAIDQVGLWSGLLSEAQIQAAANELPAGIAGAWALRGTGADRAEHGYDLTVPEPVVPTTPPDPEPTEEPEEPEPTDEPTDEPTPDPTDTGNPDEPEPTGSPEVPDETEEPTEDPTEEPTPEPTTPPAPPVEWTADQYARPDSAWNVSGDRCATSPYSVVRSDESFSVSAWARLDDASALNQTIVATDGTRISGFYLQARANGQGVPFWSLTMKAADLETSTSEWAGGTTDAFAASVGKWTHLVGVYNATAKSMTLYVNGAKVSTVTRVAAPWNASGLLTIGCAKYAGVTADYFRGAISDVKVWRGALTEAEAVAVKQANNPVKLEGQWPLEGPRSDAPTNLDDTSGNARHLAVAGAYTWEQDRAASRNGALGLALAVGSCAETTGPAVRTDGSFSVAAWVAVDELTGTRTVVSQSGAVRQGFRMEYSADAGRWRVVMPSADTSAAGLVEVRSLAAPVAGTWTHLAAVFDLPAKKLRFYVDGDLQGEVAVSTAPWQAAGPLTVGCTGTTAGARSNYLGGVVDDVRVWTSTVDPDLFGTFAHA
jgi:concanavalin A-like lectin/glucanase superfamily protein